MKLRRAAATAVAAAAIAPAALFAAPAAFAAESATATPAPSVSTTVAPAASPSVTVAPSTAATSADAPSSAPSFSPSALPSNGDLPPQELTCTSQDQNYKSALTVSMSGLPGRIAAGSGWHEFTITLSNPSATTIKDIVLGAGVAQVGGSTFIDASKIKLQAFDPVANEWFDLSDDNATSFGIIDGGDLNSGDTVQGKLRLEVDKSAPVGMSFALGLAMYPDDQHECFATSDAAYELQIAPPGKPTGGAPKPPKSGGGGTVPLPKKPPAGGGTKAVPISYTSGSSTGLAKTGASSATPIIAGIGGAAVVLGAGAMFVVRRRKSGSAA